MLWNREMARVAFFIDGFNVYHALNFREPLSSHDKTPTNYYHKYKWLDYSSLAKCFVLKSDEIVDIFYFTAYAEWSGSKIARHKLFVRALEMKGVKIVFGKFKLRDKHCPLCKRNYRTHEEKQTDVNISVKLFQCAQKDIFDKAILITGDSDILPAVLAVKESFPKKNIGVVVPIGRSAGELEAVCDSHYRMKEYHLKDSQFPDVIVIDEKNKIYLNRPESWK